MAVVRISKRTLEAEQAAGSYDILWDSELRGFGAKLNRNGTVSFMVQYRTGGRGSPSRRFKFGRLGSLTADEARAAAKKLLADIALGADPMEAKKLKRQEDKELGFRAISEEFIAIELKLNWSNTFRATAGDVRNVFVKAFGDTPITSIKRRDIEVLLDSYIDRPARRKFLHSLIRRFFNWAVETHRIDRSPMVGSRAPRPVSARERVLTPFEVWLLWHAADDLGYPFCWLFRFLLLTGQRRQAAASMEFSQLDGLHTDEPSWICPASIMKAGRSHVVPLSKLAATTLLACPRFDDRFVFTTTGKGAPSGFSKAKLKWQEKALEILGTVDMDLSASTTALNEHWVLHDFRRTCATGMQAAGVPIAVTGACLAHASGINAGVSKVYNLHDYLDEKREALNDWSAMIEKVISIKEPRDIPSSWRSVWLPLNIAAQSNSRGCRL